MEVLATASGVISVVSLAGQIVQGCGYLCTIFDEAKTAPQEIRFIITELAIIEGIVRSTPDIDKHQDELDFCHERLLKLRNIVEKYGVLDSTGRGKKWGTRLGMALNSDKIQKHLTGLREAKEYLLHIQNVSAHNQNLLKSHEILESVQQLSTSNSEALRILSHTEEITAKTQQALHELADRFVHRETATSLHNEHGATKIINALDNLLRQQLADHFARLSIKGAGDIKTSSLNHGSPSFQVPNCLENSSLRSDRSQLPINSTKPESIASSAQTTSKPSILDYSDLDNEMGKKKPSQAETTSRYQSSLGVVVMRISSSAYHSLLELREAELEDHFPANWEEPKLFPVTITTAEILLLPQNWRKDQLTLVKIQNLHFIASKGFGRSLQACGFTANHDSKEALVTTRYHQRSAKSSNNITKYSANHIRAPRSSLIVQSAFRTAFKHAHLAFSKPKPPIRTLERNHHRLRNSFDSEINDAIELVYLWLHSGFSNNIFNDGSPVKKITIPQRQKFPSDHRLRSFVHIDHLRLQYINELVTDMVLKSAGESNGDEYQNLNFDVIHDNYWRHITRAVIYDLRSADVDNNPIITFLERQGCPLLNKSKEGRPIIAFRHSISFCFLRFVVGFVDALLENLTINLSEFWHETAIFRRSLEPILCNFRSIIELGLQDATRNAHKDCLDCFVLSELPDDDRFTPVTLEDCIDILRMSPWSIWEEIRERRKSSRIRIDETTDNFLFVQHDILSVFSNQLRLGNP